MNYILVIVVTRNSCKWKQKSWSEDIGDRFWKIHVFEVVQVNRVSVLRVVVSAVTSKTFQERTFISPISCEPQWIIIGRILGHTCCRVCRGRCGCCGWCCLFCCVKKNTSLLQAMEYIKQSSIPVKLNVTHSSCVTVLLLVFLCKEVLFWYRLKVNLILEHLGSCKWCPHNVQRGNSGLGGIIWKRLLD